MAPLAALAVLISVAACGGELDTGTMEEARSAIEARTSSSTESDGAREGLLCDRIQDQEALTPSGAEPLKHPGVEDANSERRCMALFGVDMPIGALRSFYRSTLGDLGYEVTSYREGDGIVQGNLSRTFLRATRPGMQVNVQIDEFDPAETTLARHTANVKLQIDAMGD